MSNSSALIITGPTSSGKTQLSEMIDAARLGSARLVSTSQCEIINADVGQFYKPLSVGTAKPDLVNAKYKHHLFDLLDSPQDLSVIRYRTLVIDLVEDICSRGNIPVIVGGSLFYIKSLFFPPQEFSPQEFSTQEFSICHPEPCPELCRRVDSVSIQLSIGNLNKNQQWELLQKIDPDRAAALHANDNYRISRALEIWMKTGRKPSIYKPIFKPAFNALIVYVEPEPTVLKDRINLRTTLMVKPLLANTKLGWIEEAQGLIGTEWEPFLRTKNLIGYSELFDWINAGENRNELPELIRKIQIKTTQYAKRQRTFWKSFQNQLAEPLASTQPQTKSVQTLSVGLPDEKCLTQVLTTWNSFSNK